ncbi:MAG: stage III sporulation protein AA [Firmicutes bacterium]|nr:stage III sporulation protein AA [Bacillota bacterium]
MQSPDTVQSSDAIQPSDAKGRVDGRFGELLPVLPAHLREILGRIPTEVLKNLEEIRLREERPLMLVYGGRDGFATPRSTIQELPGEPDPAYIITREDTAKTLQLMSHSSLYALEEELRNGFLTLPGGHRVGFVGKGITEDGRLKTLKNISGFNIRLAREILGAADQVLPRLVVTPPMDGKDASKVLSTLIISPPQCGKTTLLRDLARQISDGVPSLGLIGRKVGIVDERSEIAGCFNGVPQNDVGVRTDVLDTCPKAAGIMLLLRSMSPEVVVTDEIGREEDVDAVEEACHAGVAVIATAHGHDLGELLRRPGTGRVIRDGHFQRAVILSRRRGPGTVEAVLELNQE